MGIFTVHLRDCAFFSKKWTGDVIELLSISSTRIFLRNALELSRFLEENLYANYF